MNFTLIVYQEANSYHDRCGDRYSHDGSHEIHFSTDEDEIATHWSEYLLKNQYLGEAELEHEVKLLQDGKCADDHFEWGSDEHYEAEEIEKRIKTLADSKIADRLREKKLKEEADAKAKKEREERQRVEYLESQAKAERKKYEELRAKYGDQ